MTQENEITRFDINMYGLMEPSEHGEWVRYEDAQRTWVGLTEEQKELIVGMSCKKDSSHDDAERVARAIEAKLKEKNGW